MMCWETACDQTVVGDHAGWIDGQTVDAVARKRGDDVQRTAEVVGGADDVLLHIECVEHCSHGEQRRRQQRLRRGC